jgi:tetratricopeptide (TPR) repeat protein
MSAEVRATHGDSSPQLERLSAAMDNCYLALDDPAGKWNSGAAFDVAARRERPPSIALMQRAEASLISAVDHFDFDNATAERFYQSTEENAAAIVDADLRKRLLRVARMHEICVLTNRGDVEAAEAFAAPIKAELDDEFARIGRLTPHQIVFWRCLSTAQRRQGRFADAKRTAQTLIDRCAADKFAAATRCEARGLLARAQAEVDAGEYDTALQSLKERRKQPSGQGHYPDPLLVEGRALLGLGQISDAFDPLREVYAYWLESRDPRGPYAAEAEYWLGRAYLAAGDPRGRWMVAEARRTLASSALQAHRLLAGQPVP